MNRFFSVGLAICLSSCTALGPNAVRTSRTDYNVALRQTEDEQLLLNLVRLKYRDRPLFLEASALTTQFVFARSANASSDFGPETDERFGLGGRLSFEEKPTVSYTPLQGEGFVERVLTRIPLENLILLGGSGWSSERVFRACVERMNGVKNAPRAGGPTPESAPEYQQFVRACSLLRDLELKGLVVGARRQEGTELVLRFESEAKNLPEYEELMSILGLDPGLGTYPVTSSLEKPTKNRLNISTRSFIGVMYFLSQSVEAPVEDIRAGRVTVTLDDAGQPFDWTRVTDGVMRIRSSDERPKNSAVEVFYRGKWFYVEDSDLDSKSTLSMLGQVFALQSGKARGLAPVLTLPVGN